jgi:hypothetical protein
MGILGSIIPPLVLAVLDTRQHFGLRRTVASQLVCDEQARDIALRF